MRTATKRYCNTVASYWYRYRYEWEHIHSSSTSQLGFCRTVVERPIVQHGCTTCSRHCWWTWFRLSPGVTTGQGFPLRFRWFFQGMVVATVEKDQEQQPSCCSHDGSDERNSPRRDTSTTTTTNISTRTTAKPSIVSSSIIVARRRRLQEEDSTKDCHQRTSNVTPKDTRNSQNRVGQT